MAPLDGRATAAPILLTERTIAQRVRRLGVDGLDAAVAFWGAGAVEHLRLGSVSGPVRVVLNLAAGASNPDEVRRLLSHNHIRVRQHDTLHAKVYLGRCEAVVGSSNASTNGLVVEGAARGWIEANLLVTNPEVLAALRSWFDGVWREARRITVRDLAAAEHAFNERRRSPRLAAVAGKGLLTAFRTAPEVFEGKRIFVVFSDGFAPERLRRVVKKQQASAQLAADRGQWLREDLPPDELWEGVWGGPVEEDARLVLVTRSSARGKRAAYYTDYYRSPRLPLRVQGAEGDEGYIVLRDRAVAIDEMEFRLSSGEMQEVRTGWDTLSGRAYRTRKGALSLDDAVRLLDKLRGR